MKSPSFQYYTEFFSEEETNQLAKETGFMKRFRSINGFYFLMSLVFYGGSLAISLRGLRESFFFQENITREGLSKKFTPNGVDFMKKSLELLLSKKLNKPKFVTDIFSNFKDIKITDSSVIFLRDSLSNVFPGSGGRKGSSGVKLQLIYSYLTSIITSIDITKGNIPDQKHSIELLSLIKKGELFIADLGYMVFNLLYEIDIKQAYFLGRYKSSTNLYEKIIVKLKDKDTTIFIPFKIEDNIKMFQDNVTKKELYLKSNKRYLKVRVILFKNPEDTINNRRRILNKRARKNNKSGKASNKSLVLCTWSIFITNTGEEKLPYKMIHNIYRIRWNVELIFKAWKSMIKWITVIMLLTLLKQ